MPQKMQNFLVSRDLARLANRSPASSSRSCPSSSSWWWSPGSSSSTPTSPPGAPPSTGGLNFLDKVGFCQHHRRAQDRLQRPVHRRGQRRRQQRWEHRTRRVDAEASSWSLQVKQNEIRKCIKGASIYCLFLDNFVFKRIGVVWLFFFRAACEFTFSNGTLRVNKEGDSCTPKEFNQVVFLCNHCDGQTNRIIEMIVWFLQTCGPACPEISCQFVKYGQNKDYVWMQVQMNI